MYSLSSNHVTPYNSEQSVLESDNTLKLPTSSPPIR
jgi:hypothetical protein